MTIRYSQKAAPPYRMIAIDLDGTLLSHEGIVTPRTKAAVHAALAAGLLVCFATGRNWTESKTVLEAVAHYPTAVFVGGAVVMDTEKEITLHRTLMEPALAAAVCGFFEDRGFAALALQEIGQTGADYFASADRPIDSASTLWMELTQSTLHLRPDLASPAAHDHTMRVGVVVPGGTAGGTMAALVERFGDSIFCHNVAVMAHNVEVIEVFDPAVNKWAGLLTVAAHHGILPQQIVAIGDDVNDLPMLRSAGLGVAMGNARAEVQAVAKRVIGTNREDGLAAFLEELVAQHLVQPMTDLSP
jgi:hydroxymethylpyrimidine pyrophosphatase-like HAD family hydrolase